MAEEIETVIKYESSFSFGIKELWQSRELLFFFIWRDIKVKYKQTFFGVAWVLFQPLLMMFVFIFVLGERFKQELGDMDYGTFMLSGFLLWSVFSSALNGAANSMMSNSNIIKKIYFPRLIIPISAVASAFFDFFIALVIYFAALSYFRTPLHI
ncbi:MAG: ABC transporter permease, partial [Bacteroidota bacterium]